MFVSTRRKTAGEHRSAGILRSGTDSVQELNHWAWTGWMPEAERAYPRLELQGPGQEPALVAA